MKHRRIHHIDEPTGSLPLMGISERLRVDIGALRSGLFVDQLKIVPQITLVEPRHGAPMRTHEMTHGGVFAGLEYPDHRLIVFMKDDAGLM